jgi:hypothetical protein
MPVKILISGILILVSIVMGFVLRKLGLPLNTAVFNIHKLVALAGAVLGVIGYVGQLKTGVGGGLAVFLAVAAAVLTAGLFATGAMMSVAKTIGGALRDLHRAATVLLVADLVTALVILRPR